MYWTLKISAELVWVGAGWKYRRLPEEIIWLLILRIRKLFSFLFFSHDSDFHHSLLPPHIFVLLSPLSCYWFLLVYFSSVWYFGIHLSCFPFKYSSSLLSITYNSLIRVSVLFPTSWIILIIINLNYFSSSLLISS